MDNFLDTFLESIEEEIDSYYMEKKTREEYAMRKFKRRYDYNSKDKTIKNPDNKRAKIDIDINNKKMPVTSLDGTSKEHDRGLATDVNSPDQKIYLDKNYFKLKGSKRKDAVLNHEVGHTKFHSFTNSNDDTKSEYMGNKLIDELYESIYRKNVEDYKIPESIVKSVLDGPELLDVRKNLLKKYLSGKINKTILKSEYRKTAYDKIKEHVDRYKVRSRDKNGIVKFNPDVPKHTQPSEIESDLYAANKSGKSNLKKALMQYYKLSKKDAAKKFGKNSKELKDYNIKSQNDLKIRFKFLDKNNLNSNESDVYK